MKYFMMSMRFNKTSPEQFGLSKLSDNIYIRKEDNSEWSACELYDFGWGGEIGFYRLPRLTFEELFELATTTKDDDNLYGAAAMILNNHSDELLEKLELIIQNKDKKKYKKLFSALHLERPINRTLKVDQDIETINLEFMRWQRIAECIKKSN